MKENINEVSRCMSVGLSHPYEVWSRMEAEGSKLSFKLQMKLDQVSKIWGPEGRYVKEPSDIDQGKFVHDEDEDVIQTTLNR